ncbi:MAG: hypothetical protein HQM08_03690 [Candidatus Riflebacteria bacterium]|nr:hypothetical protein [Candidatus Riflebacteria bacterium]
MKCFSRVFFILCLTLLSGSLFAQTEALPKELTDVRVNICPVSGSFTHEEFAAIFEGKIYHFSCATATAEFIKKPAEFIAKIKSPLEQKLTVSNTDGICPISKKPAKPEFFQVHGDSVTFYCSSECPRQDCPKIEPIAIATPTAQTPQALKDQPQAGQVPVASAPLDKK